MLSNDLCALLATMSSYAWLLLSRGVRVLELRVNVYVRDHKRRAHTIMSSNAN